eukprot:TRINITY_DN41411_c0_g1_i1.p2 TRINITY_DN41411_c0_g1~~TRINITY_DN41411_c0_g1_i1.p2  ORF type:complete len:103 (+),score=32.69 TRINITY_DN41411_c0_g1_i1:55-363(+)
MPVSHIVLLKMRKLTPEELQGIRDEAAKLKTAVPGVLEAAFGENYTDRSLGYTHILDVRLESKEAEAAYQPHPAHVAFRDQHLVPFLDKEAQAKVLAVDYEV